MEKQNYSKFSCFWETEPVGCRRISCDFFHRKARNINGLYLPPSNRVQTLNPKVKPTYQQRHQSKNDETASSSPYGKETGRYTYLNSPEPRLSAYVVYRTVTQKPNFNGSTDVPLKQDVQGGILHPANRQDSFGNQENILLPSHPPLIINLNDEEDDEEDDGEEENFVSNWRPKTTSDIEEERAIRDICYKSGEYYGIQNPHKHQSTKTVSSPWQDELSPLEATEQNLQKGKYRIHKYERRVPIESTPRTDPRSFDNGEHSLTFLLPFFSGVPESYSQKCSKQKNQPDTNRRFWAQPENYGKYTSGPSNSPTWKKRNPQRKLIS
ncbi:uncharacterized protein C12orf50 homolog [Pithys albifrons albifrons]|uniref:uncharacterized protein C12orf50 homolog n=1 Tax=Pithys albifrons albifrons TaxID=3385563 RepID=UPI003A5D1EA4